uniref:Uncharacterized protein n=1 Tax=viral metagenome TaxID=1070528 RepID=A0A6C0BM37_9ZZZZ
MSISHYSYYQFDELIDQLQNRIYFNRLSVCGHYVSKSTHMLG